MWAAHCANANAVDLNVFRPQRTSFISLFKGKQTAPLAVVELKQQKAVKENG